MARGVAARSLMLLGACLATACAGGYQGRSVWVEAAARARPASPLPLSEDDLARLRTRFQELAAELGCAPVEPTPGEPPRSYQVLLYVCGEHGPLESPPIFLSLQIPADASYAVVVVNDWKRPGGSLELETLTVLFREVLSELFPGRAVEVSSQDLGWWPP